MSKKNNTTYVIRDNSVKIESGAAEVGRAVTEAMKAVQLAMEALKAATKTENIGIKVCQPDREVL